MSNCMIATAGNIKKLRQSHGLTQEDLAAKAGCGLATIQRAEGGKRVAADTLASIAAAFDVPASALTAEPNESFEPYLPLAPLPQGRPLVALLLGKERIDFGFCELDNLDDAETIEALHDFCHELTSVEPGLAPLALVRNELTARDHLGALKSRGFSVGGAAFSISAYEIDDDGGTGPGIIMAQWDESCAAIRVGRTADDISRAHVLRALDQWESVKYDAVIYPPSSEREDASESESDWGAIVVAPPDKAKD